MHAQLMGLHIVTGGKRIIIAPPQAARLSLTTVAIKTHTSPFNGYILPGIANLGPVIPFTLKVVAWNGLNAKNWLTGRTWGFVLKFKNYGNSPGVEFTIQKKVPYYQANPIGPEKSWLPQPGIRLYPFSLLTPQAISPMVVNLSTVMVKGLQ